MLELLLLNATLNPQHRYKAFFCLNVTSSVTLENSPSLRLGHDSHHLCTRFFFVNITNLLCDNLRSYD